MKPELILDAKAELGEGPVWDAETQTLYWVNVKTGEIHQFQPQTDTDHVIFKTTEAVGCAVLRKQGGLALGLKSGLYILPAGEKTPKLFANPEAHLPGNRFNDGKCDPAGRWLAGTMDDAEIEASGAFYSLAPDGTVKTLLTSISISNGLAWSPDYGTLYYIDTPTRVVMAYDYDLSSGDIANGRAVIHIPEGMGWPDGMTSDSEGMLWVALWGGAKLTRWDPATGSLTQAIPLPALNVTSCVFGGEGLTDLYITSARIGINADQLAQYPYSGGLFRIQTGIRGMPTFKFGG